MSVFAWRNRSWKTRAQRYLGHPTLTQLFRGPGHYKKTRRALMVMAAVLEYGCTQRAVSDHGSLHDPTISRLVGGVEDE